MSNYGNPPENPYGEQPTAPYGGQQANPYGETQAYGGGQGGYPAYGGSYGDPNLPQGPSGKGFFGSLFDFSFTSFITPKVVKVVYALAVGLLVLLWLFFLVAAFVEGAGGGLAVLIIGPPVLILYLCLIRMTLEFYVAIVRMSEDIHHRLR